MSNNPMRARITQMLELAANAPGRFQTCRTRNNLKIDIMAKERTTYLQISRSSFYPTLQDWADVTRHWPYPLNVLPKKRKQYGRYYLGACWIPQSERSPVFVFPKGSSRGEDNM